MADTIAAIATPSGYSGIGIVRISGPLCSEIAKAIFHPYRTFHPLSSHRLFYGHVRKPTNGQIIDEALAVFMKAPKTYTREDCLEIQAHGGTGVLQEILKVVLDQGARLAEPGEFTLRAFLNGRIDLTQAEAVVDIIQARSQTGLRLAQRQLHGELSSALRGLKEDLIDCLSVLEAAIDFPEERIPDPQSFALSDILKRAELAVLDLIASFSKGRLCRDGASIMIVGTPNAGKSTLFNALLGYERAIVTAIPGTTRDLVEEWMEWKGMPIRAIDTAGLREAKDAIEEEGHRLLLERLRQVDLLIWVFDVNRPPEPLMSGLEDITRATPGIVALNKIDLPAHLSLEELPPFLRSYPVVRISGKEASGIEALLDQARDCLIGSSVADALLLTNVRHKTLLDRAATYLHRAISSLEQTSYVELAAADLHEALETVGELLGENISEEVLSRIFSRFCIGK